MSRVSPDLPASLTRLLQGGRAPKAPDVAPADGNFAAVMDSHAPAQTQARRAAPQQRQEARRDAAAGGAPAKSDATAGTQSAADKTANKAADKADGETQMICPSEAASDGTASDTRATGPSEVQADATLLPATTPVNPVAPPPPAPVASEAPGTDADETAALPVAAAEPAPAPAATPPLQTADGESAAAPHNAGAPKEKPKAATASPAPGTPDESESPETESQATTNSDTPAKPAAPHSQHAQAPSNAADDKPGKPETASKETARDGAERPLPPEPQTQGPHRGHAEPTQFLAQPLAANHAAASQAQAASTTASVAQSVPVHAVALEIAGQARAGNSRFEIRLDPPELGRIDVRLDVDRDGNVSSRLVIDRAETYDLLRRDQSTLERALQQAGLKTSDQSLQFSLRDQGLPQRQHDEASPRMTAALLQDGEVLPGEAASGYARLIGRSGGVDIRV